MDGQDAKIFITILLIIVLISAVFLFFIFTLYRHHKKYKSIYEQQLNAEIKSIELERQRIAADLHDDIGPIISSVKLQLESIPALGLDYQKTVVRSINHLNNVVVKLKETSNNLVPSILAKEGFIEAIRSFASDINNSRRNYLAVEILLTVSPIISDRDIHLFRIVQEVVNNAIKHADATEISLKLFELKKQLILEIRDNGRGFDFFDTLKRESGMGLKNILRRVDILHGEISVKSEFKKGTFYSITVPTNPV